jgi:predicted P-loop ATPase
VFFGTTNASEFLTDNTGERRFWPVDTGKQPKAKDVFEQLPLEVDQIWAEAFAAWRAGERLILTGADELESRKQQEAHRVSNAKEGLIREFLERPVPLEWSRKTVDERRMYWADPVKTVDTEERDRVCAAEVWCELFNGDLKYMKRTDANEIVGILTSIEGWQKRDGVVRCGPYGLQKGFTRQ